MADEKQLVVNLALKAGTMKQQIGAINKDIKQLQTNFKNAGAGVENFENTSEGLSAKLKLQQSVVEKLKDKLTVYKKEQEKCTATLDKAVAAYQKQESEVKALEKALEEAKNTYGENSKEVKALEDQITKANKALDTKRNSVINANNALTNMNTTISSTEAEIKGMERNISNLDSELNKLENGLDDAENGVDDLGDSFNETEADAVEFGGHMSAIGQGLIEIGDKASEAGKKVLGVMGDLIESGSEYSAEVAGTDFILKNLDITTQEIINSSSELGSVIGLTNKQYKDNATAIANYYKNMGMTTEQTNELTKSSMDLVADLAAITDMPFDEAMSRFKSGLMGNYEALDGFGINLSASTLQNSEFVKSLGKSWNSLTDNEKMLAAYNEIARQSASAQGLAAQEAQEFGMQSKLLSQKVDELKGSIGDNLLPILQPFLQNINDIVEKIREWTEKNPELTTAILAITTVIGTFLLVAGTLITTIGSMVIMWGAISGVLAGASISFGAIVGIIAGVIAIIALLAGGIASNSEGIKSAIENLKTKFSENFGNIKETFNNTWIMLQDIYNTVVQPLFDAMGILIEGVINFIADCMPGISTAFQLVFDIVKTIWDSVGKPVADFMMEIFGAVVDWFVANLPFLSQVFNDVMNVLSNIWNGIGKPLFEVLKTFISNVITTLKPIISSLGTVFQAAFNLIKSAWNILKPVFDVLVSIIGKVASVASSCMSVFSSVIIKAMNAVLTPIQWVIDKISSLFNWLGKASSKVGGFIEKINPFKSLFRTGDMGINAIVDTSGINGLGNIALSGGYYNPQTRDSLTANNMIRQVNNGVSGVSAVAQTSALDVITKQFTQEIANIKADNNKMMNVLVTTLNTMTKAMQEYVLQDHIELNNSIDLNADINVDGKAIANATAKYNDKVMSRYNKLAMR